MKIQISNALRLAAAAAAAASLTGCAVVPMAASALGSAGASSLMEKAMGSLTGGRSLSDVLGGVVPGTSATLSSKSFGDAEVKKVKKGKTTEGELKALFGEPAEDFKSPEGRVLLWRIEAPKEASKSAAKAPAPSGLVGVEKRAYRQLAVRLDKSGKAEDLKYEAGGLVK